MAGASLHYSRSSKREKLLVLQTCCQDSVWSNKRGFRGYKEKTVMRKLVLVVCSVVLCVSVAWAKDNISSQWKCDAKAGDEHSIAVGDQEGHAYHISQGKCASEKGA